jgi:BMFP domain-containing protein YqiC
MLNLNRQSIDDLLARVGEAIRNSPAQDVERNVKALLSSGLARLDLVSRADFDVQAQVLARTRAKVEALEARVAELEARASATGLPGAS